MHTLGGTGVRLQTISQGLSNGRHSLVIALSHTDPSVRFYCVLPTFSPLFSKHCTPTNIRPLWSTGFAI